MGMAFRSNTPMESGAPIEVRQQSHLDWKWGTRHFPDGRFWFNWFSLSDYRDLEAPFNFWIMQYNTALLKRLELIPTSNSPFVGIERMRINASFRMKGLFLENSKFFESFLDDQHQSTLIHVADTDIKIDWFDRVEAQPIELLDLKFRV